MLHLSAKDFALNGAQSFSGYLEIGRTAASGSNPLLEGDFSFYDRDALGSLLDRPPDIVKSGQFRHGDAVSVIAAAGSEADSNCAGVYKVSDPRWGPEIVYGHIGMPSTTDKKGFAVTATSPASDVGLQVTRFGPDRPLVIRPVWIDAVIASPAFLAVTILLTYLANVAQLLGARDAPLSNDRSGGGTGIEKRGVFANRPSRVHRKIPQFRRKK